MEKKAIIIGYVNQWGNDFNGNLFRKLDKEGYEVIDFNSPEEFISNNTAKDKSIKEIPLTYSKFWGYDQEGHLKTGWDLISMVRGMSDKRYEKTINKRLNILKQVKGLIPNTNLIVNDIFYGPLNLDRSAKWKNPLAEMFPSFYVKSSKDKTQWTQYIEELCEKEGIKFIDLFQKDSLEKLLSTISRIPK